MQKTKYEKDITAWINLTSQDNDNRELKLRIAKKTQKAKEAKEIALEVRRTANKMKEESQKMIFQAKIHSVLNLYYQSNKKSIEIANLLSLDQKFVEKILEE